MALGIVLTSTGRHASFHPPGDLVAQDLPKRLIAVSVRPAPHQSGDADDLSRRAHLKLTS